MRVLVFLERPSAGFSVVLIAFAIGSSLAPTIAGALAETYGYSAVLLGAGAVAALTAFVRPAEETSRKV